MIDLFNVTNRYRGIHANLSAVDLTIDALLSHILPLNFPKRHRKFNAMYVFGDSLSDIGNAFNLTTKAQGEGLPPLQPYFLGHFSNGSIWVEYLARLLQLPSSLHTNFATGGANTGSTNTYLANNSANLLGLQQQVDGFIAPFKTGNDRADSKAIYIVWAGANDYLGGGVTNPAIPVENLTNAVKSLVSVGAKHIMVPNLPDLGDLPANRGNNQQSTALNTLTQAHNSNLASSLNALSKSFGSSVNIIPLDVYSLFKQVFTNPAQFNFTNITDAELERVAQFQGYKDKFFFWDIMHPTTAVHLILAKSAFSLLVSANVPLQV
ncbi:SGNH/GDSL hydrolase family protein [Scytonema sp. NUACC26]|uniref:SGNH/GDSL hydrolase family protein n=1 Tax=Scytonema sp. NUACC26 TaxID=3140176 RepID=UPI0034DC3CCF